MRKVNDFRPEAGSGPARLPIKTDEQRPEPLYHQIKTQLRGLILGGRLEEGTALPSIRELAADLQCSAITIRRVYRDLESEGLIRTRQGAGTFVAGASLLNRERYRLIQAAGELERAIDMALQLQCSPGEIEAMFREILRKLVSGERGGLRRD